MSKEAPWANCSGCSWLMRDREWFAQVVHDKWANRSFFWANLSFALSLTKNEQFAQINLTKIVFFGKFFLTSNLLIPSFLMSDVSKLLRLLTKNERPLANRSGRSPKMSERANHSFFWANCSFNHFFPIVRDLFNPNIPVCDLIISIHLGPWLSFFSSALVIDLICSIPLSHFSCAWVPLFHKVLIGC